MIYTLIKQNDTKYVLCIPYSQKNIYNKHASSKVSTAVILKKSENPLLRFFKCHIIVIINLPFKLF